MKLVLLISLFSDEETEAWGSGGGFSDLLQVTQLVNRGVGIRTPGSLAAELLLPGKLKISQRLWG